MKFIIVLLVLSPFFADGQYEGTYSLSNIFMDTRVTLASGNKFIYQHRNCTNNMKGRGWYQVSGDNLELHFVKDTEVAPIDSSKSEVATLPAQDTNICCVELFIRNQFNEPLPGVSIAETVDGKFTGRLSLTDTNGHALLTTRRFGENKAITISAVFHQDIKISLLQNRDYRINVQMRPSPEAEVTEGQVYTLKVKLRGKKRLDLIPAKNEIYTKTL